MRTTPILMFGVASQFGTHFRPACRRPKNGHEEHQEPQSSRGKGVLRDFEVRRPRALKLQRGGARQTNESVLRSETDFKLQV